LEAFK